MRAFQVLLKTACAGLLFRSETDAELEPILWENCGELTVAELLKRLGRAADTPVETMELAGFFRAVSRAHRPAFDALAKLLNGHLAGVKVFKIGEVELEVYIVGTTKDGHWAGVKTQVVET